MVNQHQWILGNQFVSPRFQFKGISSGQVGEATSNPQNALPYMLASYRLSDRFVMGVNIVPSGYGHFDWPIDSIVANDSTKTYLFYYKAIVQSSYQLSNDLAIGLGLNIEDNHRLELDFVVPSQGNQINRISGLNVFPDVGLFYKINSKNYFTAAVYAPLNTYGRGISHTQTIQNNNYSSNIRDAAVIFAGLEQKPNDLWFLEEKIYWSGWSIQNNINFNNTTSGTYMRAAAWKDVWSFQYNMRYAATEKLALLGGLLYDTNPIDSTTNQIGYPLSSTLSVSGGLDISLWTNFSAQLMYLYSTFVPTAKINAGNTQGTVFADIQGAVLQLTYKT